MKCKSLFFRAGEKNLKIFFRLSKRLPLVLIYFLKFYKIVLDKLYMCIYTVYIDMHSICTEGQGVQ